MVNLLNQDETTARISQYELGTRHPSLLLLLRYSEVSRILINDLADDGIAVTALPFRTPKSRKRQVQPPR